MKLIDWAKLYPKESARDIAIRQSTYCLCGKPKHIGSMTCAECKQECEQ